MGKTHYEWSFFNGYIELPEGINVYISAGVQFILARLQYMEASYRAGSLDIILR